MKKTFVEIMVGLFVLLGCVCIGYMTIRLGKMEFFSSDQYVLKAKFNSVAGLKKGATVNMAGIQVGRVTCLSVDIESQMAVVEMKIENYLVLGDDVIASIKSSGLIGDKYIQLTPGGSDSILKPGDVITETESAVDLESLISKFVFGSVKK